MPIGPRVFDFGQPVLNVMFEANPIKNVLEGEAVALVIGKLNAIVSQNRVNDIGNSGDEIAHELCGQQLAHFLMKFDKDKLARLVNGDKEIELSLSGLHFGNVDMEIANWIGFELLLGRLVTLHIRKP